MTRHLASTRSFPVTQSPVHPHVHVTSAFPGRPCAGGSLELYPLPVGVGGQPYLGMDPSAPATWVRPYNPVPGMVARLNFDGAKLQGDTPMGGTWRVPMRDRQDVGRSWLGRMRRRGLPESAAASPDQGAGSQLFIRDG